MTSNKVAIMFQKKKMAIMDLDPFPLNPPTPLVFI